MQTKIFQMLLLLTFSGHCLFAQAATESLQPLNSSHYVGVSVDNLVIDTVGLQAAADTLSIAIAELAQAIEKLSSDGAVLTETEKATVLSAVQSVDNASVALSELAVQLPKTAQNLTDQLPQIIDGLSAPIAELSSSLEAASDGILTISESLPQATENAKRLVNDSVDSILIRVSIFAAILLVIFVLVLVWLARYLYKSYVGPIARKLDALSLAPEHFANLSKHMKQTSDNLLALQHRPASVGALSRDKSGFTGAGRRRVQARDR